MERQTNGAGLDPFERARCCNLIKIHGDYLAAINRQLYQAPTPWYVELAHVLGVAHVRLESTSAETLADMVCDLSALERPNCKHGIFAQWQECGANFRKCRAGNEFMLVDGRWMRLDLTDEDD